MIAHFLYHNFIPQNSSLLPYFGTNWLKQFFDKGHSVLSYLWSVIDVMRQSCVDARMA